GINAVLQRFPEASRWVARRIIPSELSIALALNLELNPHLMRREDFVPYLTDLAAVDVDLFSKMLGSAAVHDAYDHLGQIKSPALIVTGERDTFTPIWISVRMHSALRGSQLLVLP